MLAVNVTERTETIAHQSMGTKQTGTRKKKEGGMEENIQ